MNLEPWIPLISLVVGAVLGWVGSWFTHRHALEQERSASRHALDRERLASQHALEQERSASQHALERERLADKRILRDARRARIENNYKVLMRLSIAFRGVLRKRHQGLLEEPPRGVSSVSSSDGRAVVPVSNRDGPAAPRDGVVIAAAALPGGARPRWFDAQRCQSGGYGDRRAVGIHYRIVLDPD